MLRFDQRGTGAGALRCRDLEAAAATDAGREAAACAALLGERRGFFRTSDTVEDIEALRVELGIDRLAIVGPGYGGYVAQRYAMRYPDTWRSCCWLRPWTPRGSTRSTSTRWRPCAGSSPRSAARGCRSFTSDVLGDTARLVERLAARAAQRDDRRAQRGSGARPCSPARSCCSRSWPAMTPSSRSPNTRRPWRPRCAATRHRSCARSGGRWRPGGLIPLRLSSPAAYAATLCEEVRFPWSWHATPAERDAAAFSTEAAMDPSLAAPFDPGTWCAATSCGSAAAGRRPQPSPPPEPGPMPDVPVLVLAASDTVGSSLESARRDRGAVPRAQAARDARVSSRRSDSR